jgi:hypothetical protein
LVLAVFMIAFLWLFPKIVRRIRRMLRAVRAFLSGKEYDPAAR